jgi:uncharacterized membrane protein
VPLFKKKPFFTEPQSQEIVQAIKEAERMTSGEIRVFVEHHCRFVNAVDRAFEIFGKLQMHQTKYHNAVLVYLALKDRQFAILGDEGIHQKVGDNFWKQELIDLGKYFRENRFVDGIANCVTEIGESLKQYFPYESDGENQLPDDIVYGR